jgi:hypothetical protein
LYNWEIIWPAIRAKFVALFVNFLNIIEEDNIISRMSSLLSASIPEEIIDTGHSLVELIFGKSVIAEYTLLCVCGN